MPLLLSEILSHPALRAAEPVLRAGVDAAQTAQVRWVHSSEVLDIAALLRGGELLLTGGSNLALTSVAQQIDYVSSLARRKIAALAIETGPHLPALSAELIQTAQDADLPLVELSKVVPFVDVTQSINSILVGESAERLQRADVVSHAIAAELAAGGGLEQLLAVLAQMISADVTLTDLVGNPLGAAIAGGNADENLSQGIDIEFPVRGVVIATLHIEVPEDGDVAMARVAGERAVDILALALLQHHSPTLREAARAELVRAVAAGGNEWRLPQLSSAAGLDWRAPLVAIVVRALGPDTEALRLGHALRGPGRSTVTYSYNNEMLTLVILPYETARAERTLLLQDMVNAIAGHNRVASVGPLAVGVGEAGYSVAEARLTLDLSRERLTSMRLDSASATGPYPRLPAGSVFDAESMAVERLAHRHVQPEIRARFVEDFLADLIRHDSSRGGRLLDTLNCWLDHGCNTTAAARTLHLERQSMHNRLKRIFELIGGDPRGNGRLPGLQLATRLAGQFQLPRSISRRSQDRMSFVANRPRANPPNTAM